jgi:hypothetical protein
LLPKLLATFHSEGAYLPRVVPPNTRMFALPVKRLSQRSHHDVDEIDIGAARDGDRCDRASPCGAVAE